MAKGKNYRFYPYTPTNPEKFKGDTVPINFRSSWELEFAQHCDVLPSVISWSYEMISIPYRDPLSMTKKQRIYIPDFFVEILQSGGYSQSYLFEIKPRHEQLQEYARNRADAALIARNTAKWRAATQWADRHSAIFEILNESDLYAWHGAKRPRNNPIKTFSHTHTTPKVSAPKARKAAVKGTSSKKSVATKRMLSRVGKSKTVARAGRTKRAKRS